MDDIQKLVGARIRELRKAQHLSQEAFGEKAGFHFSYIGSIERGEKNISIINLAKIANALNVGVHQLFSNVQHYEQLTDSEGLFRDILFILQSRNEEDLRMAKNILTEIFKRTDRKS